MDYNIYQNEQEVDKYKENYSEESFLKKLMDFGRKAGESVVYASCLLFGVLKSKDATIKERSIVLAGLGYFILPIDLIPDLLPGGYLDDFAILIKALQMVNSRVTDEMKEGTLVWVKKIFKKYQEDDLAKVEAYLEKNDEEENLQVES